MKDAPRRSSTRKPAAVSKKTQAGEKIIPTKTSSAKAKHILKRSRKAPECMSENGSKKKFASHSQKAETSKAKRNSKKPDCKKKSPAKAPKPRKKNDWLAVPFETRVSKKETKPRWTPEDLALVRALDLRRF
jgi:hypothetical protein